MTPTTPSDRLAEALERIIALFEFEYPVPLQAPKIAAAALSAYRSGKGDQGADVVDRAAAIAMLKRLGEEEANAALNGEPDNARTREASNSAYERAWVAVGMMPGAAK